MCAETRPDKARPYPTQPHQPIATITTYSSPPTRPFQPRSYFLWCLPCPLYAIWAYANVETWTTGLSIYTISISSLAVWSRLLIWLPPYFIICPCATYSLHKSPNMLLPHITIPCLQAPYWRKVFHMSVQLPSLDFAFHNLHVHCPWVFIRHAPFQIPPLINL